MREVEPHGHPDVPLPTPVPVPVARRRFGGARSVAFGVALVGLLAALAGLVAFAVRNLGDVDDVPAAPATSGTSVVPPAGPVPPRALLVQQDAAGGVASVTVAAVGPGGAGGSMVFLPVGTMVEVPSFGLNPLREAFALGGVELLQQSAENLLGIAFDVVAVVSPDELVELVGPAGALRVDLPRAVEEVTGAGRIETVFPAGPVDVAPGDVPSLLERRGTGSDLDRLVRHQAFWESWLGALGEDPRTRPAASAAGGWGEVLASLASGPVGYDLLPVEVLAAGTGSDDDLYAVQAEEVRALVQEVAPGAVAGAADRVRVQVLNGTGTPGLAQEVQPALAPAGAVVTLTGNADRFDYATTQVVFYRDEHLDAARAVQRALGVGEVVRSLVVLDVVDVTVVIGADFAAEAPAAADTTETADTITTTTAPGA